MILVPLSGCERAQISICILLYVSVSYVNSNMEKTMSRYFSKNSDGTVEFTPRYIFDQLRDRISDLREKIDKEQNQLYITPKEDVAIKVIIMKKLIIYKVELGKTEDKFKSVKEWYDKNNLPYPHSTEDQRKKKLLEDYISRKKRMNEYEIKLMESWFDNNKPPSKFSKYQKYQVGRTQVGTYGFVGVCGKKDEGCTDSADYMRKHGRGLLPLCENCKELEESRSK